MDILFVEDNESEQIIMREAFKEAGVPCQLHIVGDGFEALEFLNREGPHRLAPKPSLIILDLNLPKKNGREVLVEIKQNPKWEHIPILVFSNSESPQDICHCYSNRVNAYMNKPAGFQEFIDLAHVINVFWLRLVRYCAH